MEIRISFNSLQELEEFVNEYNKSGSDVVFPKAEPVVVAKAESVATATPKRIAGKYITIQEAAKKYNTSHQLIRYYVKKKGIDNFKQNGNVRISEPEIDKYMAKSMTGKPVKSRKAKEPTDFVIWKKQMFELIDAKHLDHGAVCANIFKHLTKVYGIVWEQEKKNFYRDNGYFANSTLRLCYYMQYEEKHGEFEHYERLFENRLKDMLDAA